MTSQNERVPMKTLLAVRAGAVFYALWGLVHVAGGLLQLVTLRQGGGGALTALISSAAPVDPATAIPGPAAAFMGMGAANIAVIGALVTVFALLNWRNDRRAYWVNLLLVGSVDFNLVGFLLAPGVMAWSDGLVGLGLFVPAAILTTIGQVSPPARASAALPAAVA
jgi:hypothetical protein